MRVAVHTCLVSAAAVVLCVASLGCSGSAEGNVKLEEDPGFEYIPPEDPQDEPSSILICNYEWATSRDLEVVTYDDDPEEGGLSVYDFVDDVHMAAWITGHPTERAYRLRKRPGESSSQGIGRLLSEPCFGDGEEAVDVVRQVVIHRVPGQTPYEGLLWLLRADRTTHFLVDRDGVVYETLDPVHAAHAPTANNNVAIYVGLMAPRRTHEWLPRGHARALDSGCVGCVLGGGLARCPGERFAISAVRRRRRAHQLYDSGYASAG